MFKKGPATRVSGLRWAELMLVQPGLSGYAPAPPADAPHAREAVERGAGEGLRATAPPSWPVELALVAAETVVAAAGTPFTGWPGSRAALVRSVPKLAAAIAISHVRTLAGRRRARLMGLSALDAPRRRPPTARMLVSAGAGFVYWLVQRRRGSETGGSTWWLTSASSTIRELDKRRSWNRAYAASRASSSQARSSAPSSAGAG
jgi:hypothetical protein